MKLNIVTQVETFFFPLSSEMIQDEQDKLVNRLKDRILISEQTQLKCDCI